MGFCLLLFPWACVCTTKCGFCLLLLAFAAFAALSVPLLVRFDMKRNKKRHPAVVDDQGRTMLEAALDVGDRRVIHYLRNQFLEGPSFNAACPSDIKYKPPYLTPLDEPPLAKQLPRTAEATSE